jgi:hypothetical protein
MIAIVSTLTVGQVTPDTRIELGSLGPGGDIYASVGNMIRVEVIPFSPSEHFWENWSKCTADSTIWIGGPNIYSHIGPLMAFVEPASISVGIVDSNRAEVDKVVVQVDSPGLYHIKMRATGDNQCEKCTMFVLAKGDTLAGLR